MPNKCTYYTDGMHCPACEIIIEKKLRTDPNLTKVKATVSKGEVEIEYENQKPTLLELNQLFSAQNYHFSAEPTPAKNLAKTKNLLLTLGIGLVVILVFIGLSKLGLSNLINVNSNSSLFLFLVFGLIAGASSCAALVGGIILSLSKQWTSLYTTPETLVKKIQPILFFNLGRLLTYSLLGAVLGIIGEQIKISLQFGQVLVVIASLVMIILGLDMLGLRLLEKFKFQTPRRLTDYLLSKSNFNGRHFPFSLGVITSFLPCGFTLTVQSLALISGSALRGGLIMFLFALGTLPVLTMIGIGSAKLLSKPNHTQIFMRVAGLLVLFFAIYNLNAQLNVFGQASLNDLKLEAKNNEQTVNQTDGLPPIVNGQQVVKMEASAQEYTPSYLKVRVGIPVRWEITDTGTSGCTNAIIARGLFKDEITLTPGQTSVKEFTPTKVGRYKFSCWMGMVSGNLEVL